MKKLEETPTFTNQKNGENLNLSEKIPKKHAKQGIHAQ